MRCSHMIPSIGRAIFRHDEHGEDKDVEDRESIYNTLDELWREGLLPRDLPPLEVVIDNGKLWSLSNKRLAVFKLLQATCQQKTLWVSIRGNALCWLRSSTIRNLEKRRLASSDLITSVRLYTGASSFLSSYFASCAKRVRLALVSTVGQPDR